MRLCYQNILQEIPAEVRICGLFGNQIPFYANVVVITVRFRGDANVN